MLLKICFHRNALKLVIVGQFMDVPTSSNYDVDETPYLLSFVKDHLPYVNHENGEGISPDPLDTLVSAATPLLDFIEGNGLYYLIGWSIHKEVPKECALCMSAFVTSDINIITQKTEAILSLFKSYNSNQNLTTDNLTAHLCPPPTPLIFEYFVRVECIFRSIIESVKAFSNIENVVLSSLPSPPANIPECHTTAANSVKRFIKARLRIHAGHITSVASVKQFGSRTAARTTNIK
uniref:uncharacterized protein LOC120348323 isoform X2 n=1 Tax=Styela clava TaxID=7725 RepID=UPI001939B976|nr:uncharacterized protein LOC120348323 isoform X2 [Styela clava]